MPKKRITKVSLRKLALAIYSECENHISGEDELNRDHVLYHIASMITATCGTAGFVVSIPKVPFTESKNISGEGLLF